MSLVLPTQLTVTLCLLFCHPILLSSFWSHFNTSYHPIAMRRMQGKNLHWWDTETHKCTQRWKSLRRWLTKLNACNKECKPWCNLKTVDVFVLCIIVEKRGTSYMKLFYSSLIQFFFWESNLESSLTTISAFPTALLLLPHYYCYWPIGLLFWSHTYCTAALKIWYYLKVYCRTVNYHSFKISYQLHKSVQFLAPYWMMSQNNLTWKLLSFGAS